MGICFFRPECCDGNSLGGDNYNLIYVLEHTHCLSPIFPEPPTPTREPGNNSTDIDPIRPSPLPPINMTELEELLRRIAAETAEWKWRFVDMPLTLSKMTGSISIISCTFVIITFILVSIYRPVLAKRCSLRLSVAVSCCDLIFSLCQSIDSNGSDTWRCTASAVMQAWAELLSLFFTSMIALNLLLVFVFDFSDTKKIEPFYYLIPLVLATTLVAVPAGLGISISLLFKMLGQAFIATANTADWMGFQQFSCFFRYDSPDMTVDQTKEVLYKIEWAFYTSWMIACITWCFTVTILFWRALHIKNARKNMPHRDVASTRNETAITSTMNGNVIAPIPAIESSTGKGSEASSKIQQHSQHLIQKAVMRIAWYPVVPLIAALPLALGLSIRELANVWQFTWYSVMVSNLQGFGNALIFYFDPAVALARETFRQHLSDKYVLCYHPIGDNGFRKASPPCLKPFKKYLYLFFRIISSRKRDFIVETKKGKLTTMKYTKSISASVDTKVVKSAPIESSNGNDDLPPLTPIDAIPSYGEGSMPGGSYLGPGKDYAAKDSLVQAAQNSFQDSNFDPAVLQPLAQASQFIQEENGGRDQIELQVISDNAQAAAGVISNYAQAADASEYAEQNDDDDIPDDHVLMQNMRYL